MADTEKTPTITDVKNVLSNACGGYSKMYLAAYAWCGGDYKAKSRAVVLTAIIDYVASKQKDIKSKPGENPWYLFTDSHWQERLQMDRGTMKAALDWLEKVGLVCIRKFGAGKGEVPKRHISLDLETLVTLIRETQDRGPEASKVRHPTILDSGEIKPYTLAPPKKERERGEKGKFKASAGNPAGVTAGVSAITPVKFRQSNAGVSADATAGSSTEYLREIPQEVGEIPVTKSMYDTKTITDIMEDDIGHYCPDEQQQTEGDGNLARLPQAATISTQHFETSFDFPGNSEQQPKPSAPKETKEAPAPQLPGKGEEAERPSVRAVARAFKKPSQFLETIKDRMQPLSSVGGDPWNVLGFEDRGSVAAASSLGWKYAVRGNDLKDICLHFPGCPIEGWDIWTKTECDDGAEIPVESRKTEHDVCLTVVQAWLEYAEYKGLPDPWEAIAGKDRDTEWPRIVTRATKDFPTWEDKKFREYFKSAYQELRRVK
jgi:hypothetical protein